MCFRIFSRSRLEKCTIENTDWLAFDNEIHAKIVDVYDGDTVTIAFNLSKTPYLMRCRLFGIDAPELKPPKERVNREKEIEDALVAKSRLSELCLNKVCYVVCNGWDKYGGRILGTLYTKKGGENLNEKMVKEKLVQIYDGKKKVPWLERNSNYSL